VPYSRFPNPDDAIEKIKSHEIYDQYPYATIDVYYVLGLKDKFDCALIDKRVGILIEEMTAAGYTKTNINEPAIIDVAKKRKIYYFLTNIKYQKKILRKVLTKF